jgi:hypothetical protein
LKKFGNGVRKCEGMSFDEKEINVEMRCIIMKLKLK